LMTVLSKERTALLAQNSEIEAMRDALAKYAPQNDETMTHVVKISEVWALNIFMVQMLDKLTIQVIAAKDCASARAVLTTKRTKIHQKVTKSHADFKVGFDGYARIKGITGNDSIDQLKSALEERLVMLTTIIDTFAEQIKLLDKIIAQT